MWLLNLEEIIDQLLEIYFFLKIYPCDCIYLHMGGLWETFKGNCCKDDRQLRRLEMEPPCSILKCAEI